MPQRFAMLTVVPALIIRRVTGRWRSGPGITRRLRSRRYRSSAVALQLTVAVRDVAGATRDVESGLPHSAFRIAAHRYQGAIVNPNIAAASLVRTRRQPLRDCRT